MSQELGDDQNHRALKNTGPDEGILVAACLNAGRDERDEQRGATAKTGSHDACGEPATLFEPLQRRPDAAAVNEGRADAGKAVQRVQRWQRGCIAKACPAETAKQS